MQHVDLSNPRENPVFKAIEILSNWEDILDLNVS